jgi:hypothetical protein
MMSSNDSVLVSCVLSTVTQGHRLFPKLRRSRQVEYSGDDLLGWVSMLVYQALAKK